MADAPDRAIPSPAAQAVGRWIRLTMVACAVFVLFWVRRDAPWTPMQIAGACVIVPSLLLWMTVQFQLGDSFSVRPQARALVTHGIYSRIRNPIYVFSTFFLAGVCLFVEKPIFLLGLLILIPAQIARARKEAQVLEEKFGDAYREYRRKTWF
jgi:protein-S-isoprenylcysteine O-methyltransferase Ste14